MPLLTSSPDAKGTPALVSRSLGSGLLEAHQEFDFDSFLRTSLIWGARFLLFHDLTSWFGFCYFFLFVYLF